MRNKKMWGKYKIYYLLIVNILWQVIWFKREQCKIFLIKVYIIKFYLLISKCIYEMD